MRIIDYKQTVTVVASADEWKAFCEEYLPSEIQSKIMRRVRSTRVVERHSILMNFDYRLADVLRFMGSTTRVTVENQTRAGAVREMLAKGAPS